MRTLEEDLVFRIKEQIGHLKLFVDETDRLHSEVKKESEIVRELKKSNPSLKPKDVSERLVSIMMNSWRIYVLTEQATKYHLPILREFELMAKVNKVELNLTENEKEISERLPSGVQILLIPGSEGLKPFDEAVFNQLELNQNELYSKEESLLACFNEI